MKPYSDYLPAEFDQASEIRRASEMRACDKLLDLMRLHHSKGDPHARPVFCPPALKRIEVRAVPPPVPMVQNQLLVVANEILGIMKKADDSLVEIAENDTRITVRRIQDAAVRHFDVSRADLLSPRRTKDVVRARQVAMYLCKTETFRSFPDIGRRFGGRDHTTVLHAIRKVKANLSEYESDLNAIRARLS